jgi:hypothetical protein
MKNLIEHRFSCENLFFKYLKKQITFEELISNLKDIEYTIIRNRINEGLPIVGFNLWFKFGNDDTLVTTISDIEKDLCNSNRELRLEEFELVIGLDPNNELRIYFS